MVFNDTVTKDGLIQDCEFLLSLGDGTISGNTSLLQTFTALINRAYDKTAGIILQFQSDWEWDDTNYGANPIGTTNLTDGQSSVQIVSALSGANIATFLRIIKVQIKDQNGYYQNLLPIDENQSDTPLSTVYQTAGFPRYYREVGATLELYPSVSQSYVTLALGFRIYYQRAENNFVSNDTTKQPGFPSIYHRILSLQSSEDYAASKNMPVLAYIQNEKKEWLDSLGWGTANRNRDKRVRLISRQSKTSYE